MMISVVTVCFRSEATIGDACRSVCIQDHSSIEHVVVDGLSDDGTVACARVALRSGGRVISEPDAGIYDAMNKGARLAQGEVIGYLNSDDVYAHRSVLSRVAEVFRDPSVSICYGDVVYVASSDLTDVRRWWRSGACRPGALGLGWIPAHPGFFVRRALLNACGGFDLSLRLAADHELMSRLLTTTSSRVVYLPSVLVKMRLGGATNVSWRNVLNGNREILRGLRQNHIPLSPLAPLWKGLDRLRQRLDSARLRAACAAQRSTRG